MSPDADVLRQLLVGLQSVGNGLGRKGTFRMHVLLGMLLHEVADEIERHKKHADAIAKPSRS